MDVILTKDVPKLGSAGEIVKVKPGYGRNYLLPRGLALVATRGNIAQHEHHRRAIARELERVRAEHQKLADQLRGISVSIARKVGKDDKLFGSVGVRDIAEALEVQKVAIDKRLIELAEPIRTVGVHEVPVRFTSDIEVTIKVTVVGI
ncbi:MAG: 50S ribosomal protein L9 [Deltaproteobacteria bacterium]|nr:50S ribosomal protein L9 [Deltaproteobacteria bacterium]MBK8234932.1 50S ribosomal protein L9 [Deltaproteobacteria bacterium]MBK8716756.1 50S ribosomal protein L9 [Deltaproteobacteria bacterium]MBP7285277.1 50S ribosomal protein L9 [Nannocystaceae bacterium]